MTRNFSFGEDSSTTEGPLRKEVQIACFRVGVEMYGLDIMRIKEIVRPQKLTPIPRVGRFIEGVMSLRGAVVPVIDLRKRFEVQLQAPGRKERIVISSVAGKIIGLHVDEVTEVRRYTREDVLGTPEFLRGRGADYFLGVCRRDDDMVLLLDLEKILSTEERIDLSKLETVPV